MRSGERHHVDLTQDLDAFVTTGRCFNKPAVLLVAAPHMHSQDHVFHQAENGVWLVKSVPAEFLSQE